ncbi:MAG: hypothetical protein JST36_01515 [Bacteroidetes bacterium]|nr:hypothetical protein [Bacteroidota bacterium]
MLDELLNLVKQAGQQAVVENPAVPNEQNDAVMQEASSSIFSGLQGMLQSGGAGALKGLFEGVQSGDNNHPAVQQVANNFSGSLMEKFGLNSGAAKALAISLIPTVLGKLMNSSQNAEAGSSFSITNILGSLMGGGAAPATAGAAAGQPSGGGIMDTISSIGSKMGFDKDGDGDADLSDLMAMFTKK